MAVTIMLVLQVGALGNLGEASLALVEAASHNKGREASLLEVGEDNKHRLEEVASCKEAKVNNSYSFHNMDQQVEVNNSSFHKVRVNATNPHLHVQNHFNDDDGHCHYHYFHSVHLFNVLQSYSEDHHPFSMLHNLAS